MNKYLLASIFTLYASIGFAQKELEASKAFEDKNYFKAIELYSTLSDSSPQNFDYAYHAGLSYLKTNLHPENALQFLRRAAKIKSDGSDVLLDLARAYMFYFRYDSAKIAVDRYLKNPKKKNQGRAAELMADCEAAPELMSYPVNVKIENAGNNINSEFPDYNAYVNEDETELVFTTRRKTALAPRPEFDGYYPSDIFISHMQPDGWSVAKDISPAINTPYDEICVGLSGNGDTVFIYIDHIEDYGDLYMSSKDLNGDFQRPKKIEGHINSGFIEASATLSPDGNTIIFSSNRSGGAGGFDLYMARKLPDNSWGRIQSLGPTINTPFDEDFPTLSSDGKTLYFSSNGHPGMGGFDLFFSNWDPITNTWTNPQNLGYPINTPGEDRTISFCHNESAAYVSGYRKNTEGDLDIYRVTYKERVAEPAIFRVAVEEGEETLQDSLPQISIRNAKDQLIGQYLPNKYNGKYIFALYPGKYYLSVDASGYKPYNEVMVVNDFHTRQEQNVKVINLEK